MSHKEVRKYPLELRTGRLFCRMPKGAKVLTVNVIANTRMVWAEVDPRADIEVKKFILYASNEPMDKGHGAYAGTFFDLVKGTHVSHLYEAK